MRSLRYLLRLRYDCCRHQFRLMMKKGLIKFRRTGWIRSDRLQEKFYMCTVNQWPNTSAGAMRWNGRDRIDFEEGSTLFARMSAVISTGPSTFIRTCLAGKYISRISRRPRCISDAAPSMISVDREQAFRATLGMSRVESPALRKSSLVLRECVLTYYGRVMHDLCQNPTEDHVSRNMRKKKRPEVSA
jgi:hypothetical protein